MLFNARAAGFYVGVTASTVEKWSQIGLIPYGVRPLQDGRPTFHRWDLDYARDVVKPTRKGAGRIALNQPLKRVPAGILLQR
jgi:hypothetical protein